MSFILSHLNESLSFLDKHDTTFPSSHQVENILNQLCDYTSTLKKELELALSYAEQLQVNSSTTGDLEGLEKSHPLIHRRLISEIEEFDFTHSTAKNVL